MKKSIFIFLSVIVIAFTANSCQKKWWLGGLGGREMSQKYSYIEEEIDISIIGGSTSGGSSGELGAIIVYFNPLCLYDKEKVSIYIDDEYYGDITLPITIEAEQIKFGSEQTVSAILDVGMHTLNAKLKTKLKEYDLGSASFPIRPNYCRKVCLELPCPDE